MIKQGRFHSLRVKFFIVLLVALASGFGLGSLVQVVGDYYIGSVYMDDETAIQRCQQIMEQFSDYVQEEQLSMQEDAAEIIRWTKNQNHIYLMIQDNNTIVIDSGWWYENSYYSAYDQEDSDNIASQEEGWEVVAPEDETDETNETDEAAEGKSSDYTEDATVPSTAAYATQEGEDESAYTDTADSQEFRTNYDIGLGASPVEFSDGTYQVYIYDFSEEPLYELVTVSTYVVAIVVFITIMLLYHRATIRQIIKLSQEVENIAQGNLEGSITVRSRNEIGVLAQHVDSMRCSIMQEMRAEQEAWNANRDLITRMSHDIRTPLTVLLGFLELLDEGKYSQEASYDSYLGICKKNAYQLKELADKLFQYFLVFGRQECDWNLEVTDAKVLLEQLIGEHLVLLLEQHWQVENTPLEQHVLVEADPLFVKRLFDNLFSNIEKYADPARPVTITQLQEGDAIRVSVHNFIAPNPNPVESTNIGLKTCEHIVQQMGGVFQYEKTEQEFSVHFTIPFYHESEQLGA